MAERKCSHWLETFENWTVPRCDAPERFIFWSGLFTVAAALRRNVVIPKSILGSWECYPYLYVFLVGPPGTRKTTAARFGSGLLEKLPELIPAPSAPSQAALAEKLSKTEDSALYIVAEEFGELLSKSGNGREMYDFLAAAFDGKKSFEIATISRGTQIIMNPCVSLITGTTLKWISEHMPEGAIGGGFASRVLFLYEEELSKEAFFYTKAVGRELDWTLLNKYQDDLEHDLKLISNLKGEFKITDDAQRFGEAWFREMKNKKQTDPKLSLYFKRKHVNMLKLAMINRICYSNELVLEQHDIEFAVGLLESTEKNLPRIFEGVGKNPFAFDMKDIVRYVELKKVVSKKELLDQFVTVADPEKLPALIDALVSVGRLKSISLTDGIMGYTLGARRT